MINDVNCVKIIRRCQESNPANRGESSTCEPPEDAPKKLLNDWFLSCVDRNVTSTKINHAYYLKRDIKQRFPDSIGFFKTRRHVIVNFQFANPSEYSTNTLMGAGMQNE